MGPGQSRLGAKVWAVEELLELAERMLASPGSGDASSAGSPSGSGNGHGGGASSGGGIAGGGSPGGGGGSGGVGDVDGEGVFLSRPFYKLVRALATICCPEEPGGPLAVALGMKGRRCWLVARLAVRVECPASLDLLSFLAASGPCYTARRSWPRWASRDDALGLLRRHLMLLASVAEMGDSTRNMVVTAGRLKLNAEMLDAIVTGRSSGDPPRGLAAVAGVVAMAGAEVARTTTVGGSSAAAMASDRPRPATMVMNKGPMGMQPNPDFLAAVNKRFPDKTVDLVVGCLSGRRSQTAIAIMQQAEFTSLVNVEGGFTAWSGSGLPVEVPK
eukprot:jgi/Mesvir1/23283/Mv20985-RA.1